MQHYWLEVDAMTRPMRIAEERARYKEIQRMTAIYDSEAKHICHTCIGDQFLADEVNKEGTPVICSYCGETREAMTLEYLADRIHEVIEDHFERTSSEPDWFSSIMYCEKECWTAGYQMVNPSWTSIADIACVTEEIAKDQTELLSGRFRYSVNKGRWRRPLR